MSELRAKRWKICFLIIACEIEAAEFADESPIRLSIEIKMRLNWDWGNLGKF